MTAEAVGLFLDYSKNRITDRTLKLLIRLAEESGLRLHIEAMFSGEKINVTEKGAVLHVALRAPEGTSIFVDGENVVPQVHAVLKELASLANRVRSGEWKGYRQAHSQHHQHPHRRLLERRNQLGEVAETVAYDKALLNVIAAIATKSS
jgi:glucose-6-phosphate isomerase